MGDFDVNPYAPKATYVLASTCTSLLLHSKLVQRNCLRFFKKCQKTVRALRVNYNSNGDYKEIKFIIPDNGLRQIVKEPTRVTDTLSPLVYLVFTNCPVNITHTHVIIS